MTAIGMRPNLPVIMAFFVIFLLGVANFAMHGAVLANAHPLSGPAAWFRNRFNRRMSLGLEFAMLLVGLVLVANEQCWAAFAYIGYSGLNAVSAWLILYRQM
ncbi:hypothetical protein [Novosphingobium sp. FKTRR1]|uniref:hypothetical protein n=1 Tax=Novosphingobium sp. FKTRR1 TaxID=2879118 RepID=UPI001CF0081F|nr:hypothetical protein [Novosphingobium sp. FKTRR1]